MQKQFVGASGTLYLDDEGVTITRPFFRSLFMRPTGRQRFLYKDIVSVRLKRPALTVGFIQFATKDGPDLNGGAFEAIKDENAVTFHAGMLDKFIEAKRLVEERIPGQPSKTVSGLDELEKLAALKEKGIITQDEFDQKKKQLLGL